MKNIFLLIPLCICIWILSIVAVHFHTTYSYQKKLSTFVITEVENLSILNKDILNTTVISKQLIENNEFLLTMTIQSARTIDFSLNEEHLTSIYTNLLNINQLITENYSNQQIFSSLDKQHLEFIHSYLIELENTIESTILPAIQSSKKLPLDSLKRLVEATSSYYDQYKN